ncbi:MAG TPA: hypothetical protein VE547_15495, partial [Mycobacteriales bacterium]|nr:hypothetical protein [Mycobacteriales bacterium]
GVPGGPAAPAGPPALRVDPPAAAVPLHAGRPGELRIPVRNTGSGPATDLVAVVTLPAGFIVRASGTDDPDGWRCSGTAEVATCRVSELPAGTDGTVRIRVVLAGTATDGEVTGRLTATGLDPQPIPSTTVSVD